MAKNSVRDFDATAANNTDIQSVDIAENCAPSGINNAIRELMADIKDVSAGTVALESPQADSMTVTGDLTVDTSTLKVDSTNNKVGIGTTSGFGELNVKNSIQLYNDNVDGASHTDATIGEISSQVRNYGGSISTARFSSIKFCVDPTTYYHGDIRFFTNNSDGTSSAGTERMRILSSGGITFNGDTSANNALDDYEIGSWTPAYAVSGGSFSHSLQIGTYVKIGELVTATCRIRGQRSGGSGAVTMSGLPYTSRNISNLHAACSIGFTKSWNTSPKGAFTGTNATTISFKKAGSTSALSNFSDDLDAADAATAGTTNNDLILSVTYVAN